jgi:hypothetical protein
VTPLCALWRRLLCPTTAHFHTLTLAPTHSHAPLTAEVPKAGVIKFADGGVVDNLGISALLRRGFQSLIVLVSSSDPFPNGEDISPADQAKAWAKSESLM